MEPTAPVVRLKSWCPNFPAGERILCGQRSHVDRLGTHILQGGNAMKRTAGVLATVATLGLIGGLAPPAYAWGPGYGYYGNGPAYYGDPYMYPSYTGSDVTAIAVDMVNSRFRHRRVVGPGVVYYRGEYPRTYWYW
jgi:hypothetical protein